MLLTRRDIGWENQKSTSIRTQTPKKVRTTKVVAATATTFLASRLFFFSFFSGQQQQLRRISDYTIVDMRMNIRTHLCARFIFSRVPSRFFSNFSCVIWIHLNHNCPFDCGGWIITQLDSLTVPPVDRSSCSGGSTGVSIPSLKNQWRFEFNWFNSPLF